jgi:DNA-binding response OmpR family regulator
MKLLIIEDEKELSDSIVSFLNREDYLCEQAFTFGEAQEKVELYEYDCILLDLMLPGGSGIDVLRQIKQVHPATGVIIVSAKDSLNDKVKGLEIGADDYLAKPFHLPELSMRIFALMRRRNFTNDNVLHDGKLSVDLLRKEVKVGDSLLDLTKTEYELLLFLLENHKRVISKSALAEHLSGDMADMMDDYSFVYVHIKNLKAKLTAVGLSDSIKTYYGTGYKWINDDEKSAQ